MDVKDFYSARNSYFDKVCKVTSLFFFFCSLRKLSMSLLR